MEKKDRALTWTTEPPKVPGWYWQRKAGHPQSARIVRISDYGNEIRCKDGHSDRAIERCKGFEWAGPIAPPTGE